MVVFMTPTQFSDALNKLPSAQRHAPGDTFKVPVPPLEEDISHTWRYLEFSCEKCRLMFLEKPRGTHHESPFFGWKLQTPVIFIT